MARVKGALNARKRHKKVLKLARGYRGARSKQYRVAKQSVMKAMAFAFAGKESVQKPVDYKNQCGCKTEQHFLQQADSWPETG